MCLMTPLFIYPILSGLEVIQLVSISAQLSMKFQLLIDADLFKISRKFRLKKLK